MAEAVKVIVRCRPLNERENKLSCENIVRMDEERGQCGICKPGAEHPPKNFTFDGSYDTNSTTEQIYNDIAYPLVEGVVEGYNGTVFAYGQTGCGKSYSMQGVEEPSTQRGIIPRAFQHIFESIEVAENTKYLVHASYLEIYNEEIRDLLSNDIKQKMELKEHPDKGVYVKELSKHPVSNVTECEKIMASGWRNRSVGATLMNADSSRSHSIFTIYLEACDTGIDGGDHIRAGKLNLVDLAGSERQSKTGATGERLREATKINLSLSALGNVISALVDGKSKHIPYRDSKLTRLLQDSLGGNTKTLMVACLSPADNNYEETLSTLRYANRAKNIKNKPRINEDPKDALLREYQEEIQKLRSLLAGQLGPEGIKALLEGQSPPPRMKSPLAEEEEAPKQANSDGMKQEYEDKLSELKKQYEEEQMSKAKLQEDMNKLKSNYEQKIADMSKASAPQPTPQKTISESQVNTTSATPQPHTSQPQPGQVQPPQVNGISTDTGYDGSGSSVELQGEQSNAVGSALTIVKPQIATYIGTTAEGVDDETESQEGILYDEEGKPIDTIAKKHEEALKRLQMLQHSMVGGEKATDEKAKEKLRERKMYSDKRRKKLEEASKNDQEEIILNVYDSIQDEVKARDMMIKKKNEELEAVRMDVEDISYEFERDRSEYLSTIRKQEKEIALVQAMLDKLQPTIKRECNYYNLDRIRSDAIWDEEDETWQLPKLVMVKTSLPTAGFQRNGNLISADVNSSRSYPNQPTSSYASRNADVSPEEDVYLTKLRRNASDGYASSYFKPKRQVQDIISSTTRDTSKGYRVPTSPINSLSNGYSNGDSSRSSPKGSYSTGVVQTHNYNHNHNMTSSNLPSSTSYNMTSPPGVYARGGESLPSALTLRPPHRLDAISPKASSSKSKKKKKSSRDYI